MQNDQISLVGTFYKCLQMPQHLLTIPFNKGNARLHSMPTKLLDKRCWEEHGILSKFNSFSKGILVQLPTSIGHYLTDF